MIGMNIISTGELTEISSFEFSQYYHTSFVDRDTIMHFHYGLGVGHVYSHQTNPCLTQVTPSPTTQTPAHLEDEYLNNGERYQATDGEEDDVDDMDGHVGEEELDYFDQGLNASTVSLSRELDDMFPNSHTFDYEN